jgi:hypothetical protein
MYELAGFNPSKGDEFFDDCDLNRYAHAMFEYS